MKRIHRLTTAASTVLLVAVFAASPAWAQTQDLRSPDARDAAAGHVKTAPVAGSEDLRSPDARVPAERTTPVVVRVEQEPDAGMSWDSAAIGALIAAGLLVALAGAATLVARRRSPRRAVV